MGEVVAGTELSEEGRVVCTGEEVGDVGDVGLCAEELMVDMTGLPVNDPKGGAGR